MNLPTDLADPSLKILFVMGSLYQQSSGPYRTLQETALELQKCGHQPIVVGSKDNWSQAEPIDWADIPIYAFRKLGPYSLHYTPGISSWLKQINPDITAASFQSVWQYNNYLVSRWCVGKNIPYMITAHGNLNAAALEVSQWKKRIARHWFIDRMFAEAKCFQALTEAEYLSIRRYGIRQPICLVPNGIILSQQPLMTTAPINDERVKGRKVCLYLGRFHRIKNLKALIEAWALLGNLKDDWVLMLVGPDENNYQEGLIKEIDRLGLTDKVILSGPKYGTEKEACFLMASCFILPSLSEGFPVTLLEAMSYHLPVVCTTACNLPIIDSAGAGIEVGTAVEQLKLGLERLLSKTDAERVAMGRAAYQLVIEKYQWEQIVRELAQVYLWMAGHADPPQSVLFD